MVLRLFAANAALIIRTRPTNSPDIILDKCRITHNTFIKHLKIFVFIYVVILIIIYEKYSTSHDVEYIDAVDNLCCPKLRVIQVSYRLTTMFLFTVLKHSAFHNEECKQLLPKNNKYMNITNSVHFPIKRHAQRRVTVWREMSFIPPHYIIVE